MIDFDGTVKVIDFGIAKAHSNLHTTQKGKYKGKPAYMAPEYINGSHYDHRFDQFSLGVIFWELICDKKLFTGKNYIDVLKKSINVKSLFQDFTMKIFPANCKKLFLRCLIRIRENVITPYKKLLKNYLKFYTLWMKTIL